MGTCALRARPESGNNSFRKRKLPASVIWLIRRTLTRACFEAARPRQDCLTILSASTRKKMHLISGCCARRLCARSFLEPCARPGVDRSHGNGPAIFTSVWQSIPERPSSTARCCCIFLMALDSLYRRQTFRMPVGEALKDHLRPEPALSAHPHVVAARVEPLLSGVTPTTPQSCARSGQARSTPSPVACTHRRLGSTPALAAWFWMRGRAWFPKYETLIYTVALLVPIFALPRLRQRRPIAGARLRRTCGYGDRAYVSQAPRVDHCPPR